MKAVSFPPIEEEALTRAPRAVAEAAPARARIRILAWSLLALFVGLAGRAVQWSLSGAPAQSAINAPAPLHRADLIDRNGVLLATTVPAFALTAIPKNVWDAPAVARALAGHIPGLDVGQTQAKLQQRERAIVYLKRDLTPHQRDEIFALGLPGIGFQDQVRRIYPQGDLAAQALGGANAELRGDAGVELGLDQQIRGADGANEQLRLSLDVRVQHVLESELASAVATTGAQGGAGIVLDGRTGEVLAIASAPTFDANAPPAAADDHFRDRAAGSVYEMGSTIKPFTIAMALDAGQTRADEVFDLSKPIELQGYEIRDLEQLGAATPLPKALAQSSNIMAATLALRVGAVRQRAALNKLGLYEAAGIELPQSAKPLPPQGEDRLTTAVLGYGHGMAISLAALAGAYTVFANDGARVTPTLLARAPGDDIRKTPVFTPRSTRAVLAMMRQTVTSGTGRAADLHGLDLAGKTGSADKPRKGGGYSSDLMFSSFAAIFPAHDPHYVMVVALDEPQRVAAYGDKATGGAVAAPLAGRVAARIAPLLGVAINGGESP